MQRTNQVQASFRVETIADVIIGITGSVADAWDKY